MDTFKEYYNALVENKSQETHFYGVDKDTEKRAAGKDKFWGTDKFASSSALIAKLKKYDFKSDVLDSLSSGKVSLKRNSKKSFNIMTTTEFDISNIKKTLKDIFEKFMSREGIYGVTITLLKDNQIFVELNLEKGINFK